MPDDVRGRQIVLPEGGPNALALASQILASEWNLWILARAMAGDRRFSDWIRHGEISNSVLSGGLAMLTDLGLFRREAYQTNPVRHSYELTPRGRATWPALVGIWAWESRWGTVPGRPGFDIVHLPCGRVLDPCTECAACGAEIAGRHLRMTVGPSGGWLRSIPEVANRRRSRSTGVTAGEFPETMVLIGDRWSWAVVGAAFRGVTRHSEFVQFLGGPIPTITERLRTFCEIGVMQAVPDAERPDWFDYRLTSKGRAFLPVVLQTVEWGQRNFRSPEGRALVIRHEKCGRVVHPQLACRGCDRPVRLDDLGTSPAGRGGADPVPGISPVPGPRPAA
ncbi:helix-turn-helix domain-containing protein [Pseudonocardia petroleophila]|uniref:Helix-turn-helix transcriptional regulator n=1 Tax=Pseudonocardia petroleophila TaxID=37331 RepID=A0A7G7MLT6_9PSEU|nr:helix-turn-helix domain-containing protein [Pseudonocardia petroleophila]QNG53747.1 helix-turn-helix transcriptional regulator [Pseudonocardia petroleophila]